MSAENVPRMGATLTATRAPLNLRAGEPALPRLLAPRFTRLVAFGAVGGVSFVVDVGVYNLLRLSVLPDQPIGAKVISVAVATVVAWLGSRLLTFRDRSGGSLLREGTLFAATNIVGLLVAAACLFVSHYLLGFDSTLADNVSGNVIGLVLGMIVRFLGYRYLVFRHP